MSAELLAVLLAGVIVVNLTIAWTIVRGDDLRDLLDTDGRALLDQDDPDSGSETSSRSAAVDAELPAGNPPPLDADGETVTCRHCGATNHAGYRYCRWCVRSALVDESRSHGSEMPVARRPL
ncbi:MAG: hypothetical protein A07HR67_01497 [uncultured archaeon A07HR67]|nr:MAG: hypothetical protein A07HR67_01497 [uncultured archaeon A07HR67]